ncbi:nuclear transport factor 2 family protein [Halopelagius longus]|uniref:Ketosteroid isomerase-related protein n=1 Tax=Halopelagius longus TaxID=1236180 RepID=A0A1H0XW83_9EURY|nr:nuclear transport factor 2 family protein [Halopelagius longus]RDI73102.1 nuclear transport factor 2 family protein [Halopelagius longus]SDQ07172.1 Ketosteroid isomerase-related protein [Halopelagius longus]
MEPTEADDGSDADGDVGDETATAREYYEAIDAGDYDRLRSLLAPEFVHDRPDRTFEGRESFVAFMREDRPERDTTHEVVNAYRAAEGGGRAVRGRLVGADGDVRFEFVDAFAFEGGRIVRIDTFTR